MRRARFVAFAAFTLIPCFVLAFASVPQSSSEKSSDRRPSDSNFPSLKICLRLSDDSAFSGLATLQVISSQGLQITGKPTDLDGETIFPELAPGRYSIEAIAPGFALVKQTIEIKADHGLETMFLVMKTESLPDASPPIFPDAAKENAAFHIPPGIDEVVPSVLPVASCDLPAVLHGVGNRMAGSL
jgi:hypothetical protein